MSKNIDEYIASFSESTQQFLQQMRKLVKEAVPQAEEIISYKMPAFNYHGKLVYFAGYKNHIGFYPMAATIEMFKSELAGYKWAKGSIQFPLNKPLPKSLIVNMVLFRAKQNEEKALEKANKKKKKS